MRLRTAIVIGVSLVAIVSVTAHAQLSSYNEEKEFIKENQYYASGEQTSVEFITDNEIKRTEIIWNNNPIDYNKKEIDLQKNSNEKVNLIKDTKPAPIQNLSKYNKNAVQLSSNDCTNAISNSEKKYNLPPYLLQAIAITESGVNGKPNPWAMNIKGKSHYASGYNEVVNIVNRHGTKPSIDVGCSQINLKWHAHRFNDWKQLLNPQINADYAAFHLIELKKEFGSWSKAVSAYHSRTNWRGVNYACKVSSNYGKIFGDNRNGCGPDIEILSNYLLKN